MQRCEIPKWAKFHTGKISNCLKKPYFVSYFEKNVQKNNVGGEHYTMSNVKVKVNKYCFRCNSQLFKTDVRGYPYVCYKCDENMYNFERRGLK